MMMRVPKAAKRENSYRNDIFNSKATTTTTSVNCFTLLYEKEAVSTLENKIRTRFSRQQHTRMYWNVDQPKKRKEE